MQTAVERLEALLNDRDAEIATLKQYKAARDHKESWEWMRQTVSNEAECLPVPRLEIRWTDRPEIYSWIAEYCLVYRFFEGEILRMPISVTKMSGGGPNRAPIRNGKVELPWRDGMHIRHDMRNLKLPGYAVCNGVVNILQPLDVQAPYETSK